MEELVGPGSLGAGSRPGGALAPFGRMAICALVILAGATVLAGAGAAAPSLSITSPAESATIASGTVPLELNVTEFALNGSAIGGSNVAGEGHLVLFVDGVQSRVDFRTSTFVADVPSGSRTIRAELAENDGTRLGVTASVNVTIAPSAPRIRLDAPGDGASVALNWTDVAVTVTNFTLQPDKMGQAPVAGEGHWHLLVDGVIAAMSGTDAATAVDVAPGVHRLRVVLVANDHLSLNPLVYDEVMVTVAGAKAAVAITAPLMDAIIWGDSVLLVIRAENFTLAPGSLGGPPRNGEGHWLAYLDGALAGLGVGESITLSGIPPGDHWINASLVHNDNSTLGVPQQAAVRIHVAKVPVIAITAPANGTHTTTGSVMLTVAVTEFILAPDKVNQPAVAGEGHYHVFVDGAYIGAGTRGTFEVGNLTLGTHTISVQPFNNNHSAIPGAAAASITVVVEEPPQGGLLAGPGTAVVAVAVLAAAGAALYGRRQRR